MYSMSFKEEHARLFSHNVRISLKKAKIVSSIIRKKTIKRAEEILKELVEEKRSIGGKYYTKTAQELLGLLRGLKKNAEAKGLDANSLILYISPKKGTTLHRRRRKSGFGTAMKSVHVEMIGVKRRYT